MCREGWKKFGMEERAQPYNGTEGPSTRPTSYTTWLEHQAVRWLAEMSGITCCCHGRPPMRHRDICTTASDQDCKGGRQRHAIA